MTKSEKQGFINTIELAIDYNLPLSAADYMTYKQLVKEDHDVSEERKNNGKKQTTGMLYPGL